MNYLIILFVVAVAVGPIFWMMPSPRQKRQAALRDYALAQGFQMKVCDLPQSHRSKVREERLEEGIVYRLIVKQRGRKTALNHSDPSSYMLCQRENNEQTENCLALLRGALVQLPEDVVALEYNGLWLGVYWQERGTDEDIAAIKSRLIELDDQLYQDSNA
ncbi:MAG: hypothetical protein ACI9WS_002484 [Paraglaciecola psychrophila]